MTSRLHDELIETARGTQTPFDIRLAAETVLYDAVSDALQMLEVRLREAGGDWKVAGQIRIHPPARLKTVVVDVDTSAAWRKARRDAA